MSGHSKWHNIRLKKGAADAKRGKVFTVHAHLIAIAARAGADQDMNPGLRTAVERAKQDNVPNINIERAIKKGSGEDKDSAQYEELTYEAFGPGGSAFLIDVITDNKNRSLGNVRVLLSKNGGNLASAGSVVWKFEKKAYFLVKPNGKSGDEAEMSLIECGADDLEAVEDGKYEVYAAPDQLGQVRAALEKAGFKVEKDELQWKPKDEVMISELETAQKIFRLSEVLDEDEDVMRVTSNADFDEALIAQLG